MLVVTALVGGAAAVALTAVAAEVYDAVTEADGIAGLDQPVLDQAIAWRSPGLDHAITLYTDVGGPIGMPIVADRADPADGLALALANPVGAHGDRGRSGRWR